MKYLVTGGAGFMGSNFIRFLLNKYPEYEVVNFDKLTYAGNLENLKDIDKNSRYRFIKGDIADEAAVAKAMEQGIDVIINFAAETHVDRSIQGAQSFVLTDVLGTYTLLEAAKRHQIKLYVQISTDEVFGSIETGEFKPDSPFEPNSPYSASKAGGDHMVRAYHQTYGLPAIVTHSCNFYGPYQYPEKLIPLAITNLMEGKPVPVYGDGLNIREWIFTADYCRALDAVIQNGQPGQVYNIGSGQRQTNLEVVNAILKLMNRGPESIQPVPDRPGHDRRYAVDASGMRALGWQPQYEFEKALTETIEWYRANQAWWRRLKDAAYQEYYRRQYGQAQTA